MSPARLLLGLLACAVLPAWAAGPVIETRFSQQCMLASNEPALRLFDDVASWQAFNAQEPLPAFAKAPDWRRQRVLVFTLGTRPTPGYVLSLKASHLRRSDHTLQLDVTEQRPATDAFLPQVLTQPCLIVMLRKSGWQAIQIRDADSGDTLSVVRL